MLCSEDNALFPRGVSTVRKIFEIHRVRVEETQDASSVVGRVTGMTLGGTGYVSGGVDMLHFSDLFANGRAYSLLQVTTKLPIRRGDDLLVVCRRAQNGVWRVLSVANRSIATSYHHSVLLPLFYLWGLFLLSLISVLFVIGFVLAPLLLFAAGKFTLLDMPQVLSANPELGRIANLSSDEDIARATAAFDQSTPEWLLGCGAAG